MKPLRREPFDWLGWFLVTFILVFGCALLFLIGRGEAQPLPSECFSPWRDVVYQAPAPTSGPGAHPVAYVWELAGVGELETAEPKTPLVECCPAVRVRARDQWGNLSPWSEWLPARRSMGLVRGQPVRTGDFARYWLPLWRESLPACEE